MIVSNGRERHLRDGGILNYARRAPASLAIEFKFRCGFAVPALANASRSLSPAGALLNSQTLQRRCRYDRQYDGVNSTSTGMISIRPIHIRRIIATFVLSGNTS